MTRKTGARELVLRPDPIAQLNELLTVTAEEGEQNNPTTVTVGTNKPYQPPLHRVTRLVSPSTKGYNVNKVMLNGQLQKINPELLEQAKKKVNMATRKSELHNVFKGKGNVSASTYVFNNVAAAAARRTRRNRRARRSN